MENGTTGDESSVQGPGTAGNTVSKREIYHRSLFLVHRVSSPFKNDQTFNLNRHRRLEKFEIAFARYNGN